MMECNISRQFSLDFKYILLDEIALEGLEGIDIDLLWRRVEKRISMPLTEKMKKRYWDFIASSPRISFYELPEPLPYLEIKDRFTIIDEESGHLKDPDDYLDGPYEYIPVENEFGSCSQYSSRKLIDNISSLSYEKVMSSYDRKLVMVASIEERCRALAPHVPATFVTSLSPVQYCLLEIIGRSRENGQMTIGRTNLLKIVKDSKMLFYFRKSLKSAGLITVTSLTQKISERGIKSLLLRLHRFHKSSTLSLPKRGPLYNLFEHLKTREDYAEAVDTVFQKNILPNSNRNKKLVKTYNIFDFSEKKETYLNKNKKKIAIKRRYVSISTKSDSSSGSEDEAQAPPLKCQYKVGISLLRQAFMRLHESGLKGLSQVELSQLLGIEFYTTRNLCKMLKTQGLVKEVYEDKGRQRLARLIATSASANNINVGYEEEWQKFINYRNKYKQEQAISIKKEKIDAEEPTSSSENSPTELKFLADDVDWSEVVTEVKKIEPLVGYDLDNITLLSSKKSLTLRQLKYANGIIQVLEENLAVAGYQGVNNMVSKMVGEPQMDTRAIKVLIQKLITDGFAKVFKLKWPNEYKYTNYVCSSCVTCDHPIFKNKYCEILEKVHMAKESKISKDIPKDSPLSRFTIPKYTKVQKFHELIFNLTYTEHLRVNTKLPEGFNYLIDVVQEMTVEFALGNVNAYGMINLSSSQVNDTVNMKLKDVPVDISREIIYAVTFRNTVKDNLRTLAAFGLVQIVNQSLDENFNTIMFYVNRNPKIVNTIGTWPRPDADLKELENEYHLGSIEDVVDFWNTIYQISCNTEITLGKRKLVQKKPPVRMMKEVQDHDDGTRLGDGNGVCGFDSCFHLDSTKQWQRTYLETIKPTKRRTVKPIQIPKLQRKKKPKPIVKSKKVLAQEMFRERTHELNKLKVPISRVRCKQPASDKWSNLEDLIIILCKVAYTIMGPITLPGSFRLRNMVVKEIFSVKDPEKTFSVIHRRASFLDSKGTWAYEKQRLLNEFKKHQMLHKKYEGLLRKIKARNLNITKFMAEAKLPMIELIWVLLQITKTESFTTRTPCVAADYDNFHENFSICQIPDNTHHMLYHVPGASDYETTLKESIMLTIAMSYNKEVSVNIAKKIYGLFKEYPEMTLRKSIEELRKSQAISARDKVCNNKIYKMNLQDLVESSYKLSAGYYRKWICKLNAEFLQEVGDVFDLELPADDFKGGSGVNCFCLELQTVGVVELFTTTPPSLVGNTDAVDSSSSVYLIESNSKLRSGTNLIKSKTDTKKISLKINKLEDYVNAIARNAIITNPTKKNMEAHENDNIVCFLKEKQEKGSTFSEIQEITKSDSEVLIQRLQDLETKHIIKRVGFYDNRIVHIEYAKSWAMSLDGKSFLPAPWITLYGTFRHEIFFKWANVLISKLFENPGCSITHLREICELISSKSVQDVCHFLLQCECVKMKVIRSHKVDLFSDDDGVEELTDYNPYESPNNILVYPTPTCLTRYALIGRQLVRSKIE